jgi:hypothetical protein
VTDRERPLEARPAESGPAQLSRILWESRESLEMWADVVEARSGRPNGYTRGLIAEIDAYRAQHGWSRSGYGGEWVCPWCGDHFGSGDDVTPPVCDLCRKAGRSVPAQDAPESGDPGSGGSTDGRLEQMYTQMYTELVKRCRVQGRIPPHPGDPAAVWALLRELQEEDR